MATTTAPPLDVPPFRTKGSVYKRCTCAVPRGCSIDHGSWSFIADVGVDEVAGKRKQVKRGGFATEVAARKALAAFVSAMTVVEHHPTRSNLYWIAAAEILAEDVKALTLSRSADGFVYVARAGAYLKIGYSNDPERRLFEIRTRPCATKRLIEPEGLNRKSATPWLALPGSRADEKALHWLARNYRTAGEWFCADRALVNCLSRVWATASNVKQGDAMTAATFRESA